MSPSIDAPVGRSRAVGSPKHRRGNHGDQILLRSSASTSVRDSYETLRTRARTASDAFRAALGLWPNPPTNKSPRHTLAGAFAFATCVTRLGADRNAWIT